MGILDAFDHPAHKNKVSVLATLIKLSLADNVLDESEMKIIERIAKKYGIIIPEELDYIIKNHEKYSIEPTYSLDERIEQLYYLAKVVYADGKIDKSELKILKNTIVALGFSPKKLDEIYETTVGLIADETDLDEFSEAIKNVSHL
jgi:uncharacterized tellurite resistance protein B-like protein